VSRTPPYRDNFRAAAHNRAPALASAVRLKDIRASV
jgi:hypothetical protein